MDPAAAGPLEASRGARGHHKVNFPGVKRLRLGGRAALQRSLVRWMRCEVGQRAVCGVAAQSPAVRRQQQVAMDGALSLPFALKACSRVHTVPSAELKLVRNRGRARPGRWQRIV